MQNMPVKRIKSVSYAKWGYFFIAPFFLVYLIFHLIPLGSTIYNSFFENYRSGLSQIGPKFVGFKTTSPCSRMGNCQNTHGIRW